MSPKFGTVFSEQIVGQNKRLHPTHGKEESQIRSSVSRRIFAPLFLVIAFSILFARLFSLTVIDHNKYKVLADTNRVREEIIPAPRGIIYDRTGTALVRNIPGFKTKEGDLFFDHRPANPPGELTETVVREYVFGSTLAHVLGYVGEVSEKDVGHFTGRKSGLGKPIAFEAMDAIGKMGIEKKYDSLLRGEDGRILYEVDARGVKTRVLGKINPIPGQSFKLTIDEKLTEAAALALGNLKGAVVATNPHTGEVLALYASPSFDPNDFIKGGEVVEKYLTDPDLPLFNRAIAGTYPPGSTFKIISAVAGLETGAITADTTYEDTGILRVGDFSFGNWYFLQYGRTEGSVNVVRALERSNDIFFYKAGEKIGVDPLAVWGKKFGMGSPLGIDMDGEEAGVMPDTAWREARGEKWYLGDTYHISIGQGDILTTPLQVNEWSSIIANGGKLCKPYLVKIRNSNFEIRDSCQDLHIKKSTIDLVKEGMKRACDTGGTGWPLFNFKFQISNFKFPIDEKNFFDGGVASGSAQKMVRIPVACKTGTAEFGDLTKTHAWFTVFAPIESPQIAITVLVEGGGEGSTNAAPIAKKMLEEWFGR